MKHQLISVIVPVYGVERYIDRCVESLLKQTYSFIEIILVDDGSPDRSPQKCDEWATKNRKIRVIHKPNGGLSDARNAGLNAANGDFIAFVDSDDYVEPRFLESMLMASTMQKANLVICGFTTDNPLFPRENFLKKTTQPGEKALLDATLNPDITYIVAWNKLYSRQIFDVVRFPKGYIHEDEFTYYRFLEASHTVTIIEDILYHYEYNNEGITGNMASLSHLDRAEAFLDKTEYFSDHGYSKLIEISTRDAISSFIGTLVLSSRSSRVLKETRVKIIQSKFHHILDSIASEIHMITFVKILMIIYLLPFYCFLFKLKKNVSSSKVLQ